MSYTTRVLPPEEWAGIPEPELRAVVDRLDPQRNAILVVEHDGAVVGTLVLMHVLHAEFLWIAPAHRGRVSVGRRLLQALRGWAAAVKAPTVAMSAQTRLMQRLLPKLGATRLPGMHFVVRVEDLWHQQ